MHDTWYKITRQFIDNFVTKEITNTFDTLNWGVNIETYFKTQELDNENEYFHFRLKLT